MRDIEKPQRALGFLACAPDHVNEFVRCLVAARPETGWDLVCFQRVECELPAGATLVESTGGFMLPLRLWWRALRQSYAATFIAATHDDSAAALRPLIAFVSVLRCREKGIIDRSGAVRPLPRVRSAVAAWTVTTPLLGLAVVVTTIGLKVFRTPPRRRLSTRRRTAIVVPVLPDLSHTFVYREALGLRRKHPDYDVIALERGDATVVHRNAAALLDVATFVPKMTPARYLLEYLANWVRRPAAMAQLIRFFRPHTSAFAPGALADDDLAFLRLQYLNHSNYLTSGLMLARTLSTRNIGYVHVYGATYPAVRMLVAQQLLGIPFSLSTFVDFDYVTPFHMLPEKFGAARFIVVCTEFCSRRLEAGFPDLGSKVRVLHHAIDPDEPRRHEPVRLDSPPRLVYIGRFVPKKGLATLVDACSLLSRRGVSFSAHLYGKGPLEAELRMQIERCGLSHAVSLEGVIANQNIYTVMNRDDIFVSPSRYMADGERDGIPVTLLEAMAAGITVVSTPVSGIPELVEDGANGYLVEPNNPLALADLLERLLSQPADRRSVSSAAQRTIYERFALGPAVDALDGWIRGAAGA